MMNESPAFYVNKPGELGLVYNYGWYAVFTIGELSIIDRRDRRFGNHYTSASELVEIGNIATDQELYTLLADGLLTQLKMPFFAVWEIGKDKPFEERYFSIKQACKTAHSYATGEPVGSVKEKNEQIIS